MIGIETTLDPTLCKANRMVGKRGTLPPSKTEIEISYYFLRNLIGSKGEKVSKISKGEVLMFNIGSQTVGGKIIATKKDLLKISLTQPICSSLQTKISVSRRIEKHWRLIGWGLITSF